MHHNIRAFVLLSAVVLSSAASLRAQDQQQRISTSGRVVPARQVILRAMTDSVVVEVGVEAGQRVDAGQFLVRLDTRDLELAIERAEAQYESVKVDVELARVQVEAAETELKQAMLIVEQARANPAVTTFEKTMTQLDVTRAKAQVESAKLRYQQAQANVKAAELEVRATKLARHRASITAPFAGVLAHVEAELGQVVRAGETPLLHLIDTRVAVEADVPADAARKIQSGARATFGLPGADGRVIGEVVAVLPVINTQTGTVRVRIRPDDEGAERLGLRPGAAVEVEIAASQE